MLADRTLRRECANCAHAEARRRATDAVRGLEAKSIADFDWRRDVDDQLAALPGHDGAEHGAAIVRLRPCDVEPTRATAVHPAGEAAAEDLHERLHLVLSRRRERPLLHPVEEIAVRLGDGRHVLRLLLPALDLETHDAGVGDLGEMVVRAEVLRRNQIAAIELGVVLDVGEDVVLAARLRARAPIRAPLRDHAGHVALSGVGDAERAVHERLESKRRNGGANRADVVERVLARKDDAIDAELPHHFGSALVVHGHLRRPVNFEIRIDALNQPDQAKVLDDDRVNTEIDRFAEEHQRIDELGGLDENVQREVDATTTLMRDAARFAKLLERELRAVVAGVEARRAHVDGVGAIGDGGADGVQGTSGGEQLGDRHSEKLSRPHCPQNWSSDFGDGSFLTKRSAVAAAKKPSPVY